MTEPVRYSIEGSYYEACNCDAICPCRRQNGMEGGLSTYGICDFLLSWKLIKGNLGDVSLDGLMVCMAGSYDDNEPGSPWSVIIYVSQQATDAQVHSVSQLFSGEAGGNMFFTANINKIVAVRRAEIALDHTAKSEVIKIMGAAESRVQNYVEFDGTVSCGIPGHEHPGHETVSSLSVKDGPFDFSYEERCGFSTSFKYWS